MGTIIGDSIGGSSTDSSGSSFSLPLLRVPHAESSRRLGFMPGLLVGRRWAGRQRRLRDTPYRQRPIEFGSSPRVLRAVRRGPSPVPQVRSQAPGHRAVTCLPRCARRRNRPGRFDPSRKPSYHEMRYLPQPRGLVLPWAAVQNSGLRQEWAVSSPEWQFVRREVRLEGKTVEFYRHSRKQPPT